MNKQKILGLLRKYYSIWMPILAYSILCVLKYIFIMTGLDGPIASQDEWLYTQYAKDWFIYGRQYGTHYPPFYPISISFAFWFENWYDVVHLLNVLYSSLSVIVLYFIGRLYFDKKKSTFIMILGATVISQFTFPIMAFSENVYIPIFFFTIFICLKQDGWEKESILTGIANDVLFGMLLAVLCLTRYISIVTLPVFALVWVLKQLDQKIDLLKIVLRGFGIILCFIITYLPWYLLNYKDTSLKKIIGFGIASHTNPEQLTGDRLLVSAFCYITYIILLGAPILPILIRSIGILDRKKLVCGYNRLWIMIIGSCGAFFVAVTRHSWRASYNYPDFKRVMGRYLIYFPILFMILALVTWEKEKRNYQNKLKHIASWIIITVISFVLIVISYEIDLKAAFLGIHGMVQLKGSVDVYRLKIIGNIYFVVIALLLVLICFLALNEKLEKIKKHSVFIVVILLVCYNLWGIFDYHDKLLDFYEGKNTYSSGPRTAMNRILNNYTLIQGKNIYFDIQEEVALAWEQKYMNFFGNGDYLTVTDSAEIPPSGKYYVVCDGRSIEKYKNYNTEELGRFSRYGEENIVLFVDEDNDNNDEEVYSSLYLGDLFQQNKKDSEQLADSMLNLKFYQQNSDHFNEYLNKMCAGIYLDEEQRITVPSLKNIVNYNLLRYIGCKYIIYDDKLDSDEISVQDNSSEVVPIPVGELYGNTVLKQEIQVTEDNLDSVSVRLATYGKNLSFAGGRLIIALKDHESGEILSEKSIEVRDIIDDNYERLSFLPIEDSKGKIYDVILQTEEIEEENAITVWSYSGEVYGGDLSINDKKMDNDIIIRKTYRNKEIMDKIYADNRTAADLGECAPKVSLIENVIIGDEEEILGKMCKSYEENTLFLENKYAENDKPLIFPHLEKGEKAELISKTASKVIIHATVNVPRYVLINDYFGENWRLYVDGKRQKLLNGNSVLNAVYLENPGEHEIVLKYTSVYNIFFCVTIIGVIIVFLVTILLIPQKGLRRKNEEK